MHLEIKENYDHFLGKTIFNFHFFFFFAPRTCMIVIKNLWFLQDIIFEIEKHSHQ